MYTKKFINPHNKKLWESALNQAKSRFRNETSVYAQLWAKKWYKEHGGTWDKNSTEATHAETNEKQPQENRTPLMHFEQYASEDTDTEKTKNNNKDNADNNEDEKKPKHWLREPWVDISRPVHDEAGNVIGFHPCGSNTKELDDFKSSYRTSYPRCMPRSKAMRLNAMEREKLMQSNRYLREEIANIPVHSGGESEE